jgi:ArsR family transcriptional regulator
VIFPKVDIVTSLSVVERDRLARLIESGRCKVAEAPTYASQLKRLAQKTCDEGTVDRQSRLFKALGDETRLRILGVLEAREMCVCELMIALDLTQPTASHHLGLLETAGLVKRRKEGKWVFYRIADPTLIKNMRELSAS